jgi:hypothetical protein
MTDLRVTVDGMGMSASWVEENPDTREAVAAALPLAGHASRWGDELYFRVPVDVDAEETTEAVPVGAIAYWPEGNALCLFWGPTPATRDGEPRAAAPVAVVAAIQDPSPLASVDGDATVEVEARSPGN